MSLGPDDISVFEIIQPRWHWKWKPMKLGGFHISTKYVPPQNLRCTRDENLNLSSSQHDRSTPLGRRPWATDVESQGEDDEYNDSKEKEGEECQEDKEARIASLLGEQARLQHLLKAEMKKVQDMKKLEQENRELRLKVEALQRAKAEGDYYDDRPRESTARPLEPRFPRHEEITRFIHAHRSGLRVGSTLKVPVHLLRFSQGTVNSEAHFRNRESIYQLFDDLWRGAVRPLDDELKLDIAEPEPGECGFYSADNWRLVALRMLQVVRMDIVVWANCYVLNPGDRKFTEHFSTRCAGHGVTPGRAAAVAHHLGAPLFEPPARAAERQVQNLAERHPEAKFLQRVIARDDDRLTVARSSSASGIVRPSAASGMARPHRSRSRCPRSPSPPMSSGSSGNSKPWRVWRR